MSTLRQTLTVARRDFLATVATPAFLLFLLAPVIMLGLATLSSIGGRNLVVSNLDKRRIVAILSPATGDAFRTADQQVRTLIGPPPNGLPRLDLATPGADPAAQARALIRRADDAKDEVRAVLYGPLERPAILYLDRKSADYLAAVAEQSLRTRQDGNQPLSHATLTQIRRDQPGTTGRNGVAALAVTGLFMLSLLLSGQAVGVMAEERGNKVIEVLAAAVPLESVFFGKLIGMLGAAMLFLAFWGSVLGGGFFVLQYLSPAGQTARIAELTPAIGLPGFALLFLGYFIMSYLLLGAVFLSVGAQASSQREIQLLSLPITFFQMGMLALGMMAASNSGTTLTLATEIFPFSSTFAMIAHAANSPSWWPHLLALLWQALWVATVIMLGARWFRRGVLQSSNPRFRFRGLFGR